MEKGDRWPCELEITYSNVPGIKPTKETDFPFGRVAQMEALQAIVNGILLGGVYFSVASGLYILFRSLRSINLAHGDFVITAAYLCMVIVRWGAGTW